ncbi:hypothetical protein CJ671_06410 [Aliarcobacter cryaerophilus]|uniref:Uncharacterized protein n=1 Tax=Aliarcobacter cryaerophilus TaxID=28198 RepID=A0A2S9SST8_9BACT|nr:hypothetical protein CJ671_06410 [Aliarcobacter cryaerophilus]
MGIELLYLPFIIFAIPTFIYFYRKVDSKPKKVAFVLVAIAIFITMFMLRIYISTFKLKKLEKYLINFKYTYIRQHDFLLYQKEYI